MSTDVFLSYSTKDAAITEKICGALESRGVRCWMAPRDVQPGASYAQAIIEAINNSSVMVVVFSTYSDQSDQVRREVERAGSRRGMALIPVRVENVRPSGHMEYFLSSQHWLDAFEPPLKPHLDRLAQTVVAILAQKRGEKAPAIVNPPPAPSPVQQVRGRGDSKMLPFIVAGAAAVCVLLLTIGYMAYQHANYAPPDPTKVTNPLDTFVELVDAENWSEARREANRLLVDPKISKSSAYARLVRKIEDVETVQLNASLSRTVDQLKKSVQGLGPDQPAEQNISQAKALLDQLHALKPGDISRAKPSIASDVKNLEKQLETKLAGWNKQSAFDKELAGLVPTGGINQLAGDVKGVYNRYPDISKGTPIASNVEESSLWPGVLEWSNYFRKPEFRDRALLTPEASAQLIVDGAKLATPYPITVFKNEYNKRFDHLDRVRARLADLGGTKDRVQNMIAAWTVKSEYMRGIYLVHTKSGDCYTSADLSKILNSGATTIDVSYLSGYNGATTNQRMPRNDVLSVSKAPHCDLVEQLLKRFSNAPQIRTTEWVPVFSEALQAIQQARDVDPIMTVMLYQQVFRNGSSGSAAINQAFADLKGALDRAKIQPADKWFLPKNGKSKENVEIQSKREAAKRELDSIPDLAGPVRDALLIEQRLYTAPQSCFDYAGWLKRGSSGWEISDANLPSLSGSLFVVTKNSGASEAEMSEVGSVKAGQVTWAPDAQRLLLPWRPLFIKR